MQAELEFRRANIDSVLLGTLFTRVLKLWHCLIHTCVKSKFFDLTRFLLSHDVKHGIFYSEIESPTNKFMSYRVCVCVSLISTHSEKTTTTSWCLVNLQPFFLIVFTENRLIKLILSAVEVAPNRKPKTLQPPCPKYVWRSEYYFFPLILITITSNEALRLPSWRII